MAPPSGAGFARPARARSNARNQPRLIVDIKPLSGGLDANVKQPIQIGIGMFHLGTACE
jgi:hypothetical protein